MRKPNQTAYRPAVEAIEARVSASTGLGSPAHVVHAAAKHHAPPRPKHPAAPAHAKDPAAVGVAVAVTVAAPPVVVSNPTGASTEAWVRLVNLTGRDLQYRLSLGPYQGGKFLPFDLAGSGPGSDQERMSSLISNGKVVRPSFAIQFDNGPVTPLGTGPTAQAARGYYVFVDTGGQYYVSPIVGS